MTANARWEALQSRWAAGETLGADEERERVAGAAGDPLAERELALFAELRARSEGTRELSPGVVERVLESAGTRPRLHLLAPGERPPAEPKRPPRRRGAVLAAATLSLLGVAVASAVALRSKPAVEAGLPPAVAATPRFSRAELVLSSGQVTAPAAARVGHEPLATGDRLRTGEGRACLGIDPGIDVCLGENSEIAVESLLSENVRIRVERGTAIAALTRRESGHRFTLTTGNVEVRARGTVFAVERRAGSELDVVVLEGEVEVAPEGATPALVSAHARLALAPGARADPRAVGRGEEARFWALLAARELWARPELGVLEVGAGTAGLELAVDRAAPLALPFRAFVPAGRRTVSLRTPAGDERSSTVDVIAGETLVLEPRELLAKPARIEETSAVPSAASLLARARTERAAGNTPAALRSYQTLRARHPGSPEARTVLVTIG
ncbi:MAG TPA: FecR domain-containing protein, partial [Polyangiaceae bacterium]